MKISGQAKIDPQAKIDNDVRIDAFAIIEKDVEIGAGTCIGSQAIVMNGTRIGKNCQILPGAVIGGDPQDLKYEGEKTTLEIEDDVTIREFCTINRGTKASDKTTIKSHALIMAYSHIAHDCEIAEHAVVSNSVHLAGHVRIDAFAIVGGMSAIHQFVSIGAYAFVGGGTLVRKDVPPFIKAAREPLSYVGINSIGLRRRGFPQERIDAIRDIYRVLFVSHNNIGIAIKEIMATLPETEDKKFILDFISSAERGLLKGFRQIRKNDY